MIKAALIGSPNSGKTTVFNKLTGSVQRVGNWPGVTVERKQGYIRNASKDKILVVDLPGIYSLSPYSPEEIVSRDYLIGTSEEKPDVAINILDASNLERGMYLLMQVADLGLPMVVVLNMMDVAKEHGINIDVKKFSKILGCEIIETVALKSQGTDLISEAVQRAYDKKEIPNSFHYAEPMEKAIADIEEVIKDEVRDELVRWCAIKLIERDRLIIDDISPSIAAKAEEIVQRLECEMEDDGMEIVASQRYFAAEQAEKEFSTDIVSEKESFTDRLDKVLLNKWAALPIFLVILYAVYYVSIQTIGTWGTDWINEVATAYIYDNVNEWMVDNQVNDILVGLVCDGIISGVFAVLGFLPQIIVIMFCLSLLEECGYMARVAYMLDRMFMHFGLSGKTVIPGIVTVGCGVPGIMASRTIEDDQTRRITAMTTTFIPCSAKIPIITVIIAAFAPDHKALVALSCYVLGILSILLAGLILKKFRGISGTPSPFVMELPVYHEPGVHTVLTSTGERSWSFVKKAGTFILLAITLIWFLCSFDWSLSYLGANETNGSMLADIGTAVTWIFLPCGFGDHWEMTVASVTGLLAKESLLSTLTITMGTTGDEEGFITSAELIANGVSTGQGYAFLLFNLLCAPCFAAIGALRRELGSWKDTGKAVLFQCVFAYMIATIYYAFWSIYSGRDGGAMMYGDLALALAFIGILAFFAIVEDPVGRLKSKMGMQNAGSA